MAAVSHMKPLRQVGIDDEEAEAQYQASAPVRADRRQNPYG